MAKAPTSPTSSPLLGSDPVVAALQHSAALLDCDAAALPTAAFQQRARLEILQAVAAPGSATPMHRLQEAAAQWGSMFDRRRLVGLGLGAALFGLVAVPAFAAPSSVVGRMTGAVGAAIADVPALFAGAPPTASPHASDTDRDTISSTLTTTSTVSASSPATRDAALPPQGLGVIVSTIARSTAEQGEAHGDAVSSAAHSVRTSTSSVASTASTDADGHGDAVSAVAHTSPTAGENHGQQVSAVARRITTTSSSTTSTASTPEAASHGLTVATAAHMPDPAGENHGQQVSSVARGITSTAAASSTSTTSAALPPASQPGNGNGAGASASNDQGGNGKSHGR
ncbi:MAG TPA: hypothetical protein VIU62_00555 [Chloroflexota bacterium]